MTEKPLGASSPEAPGLEAREVACPLCGASAGARLRGYDGKAGPEVFAFLGLPGRVSQWTVCAGCGFVYQNPRPDPARVLALYERGLYREHREYGAYFFRNRYRGPVEHYRWLARRARVGAGPRIIDIGAGFGGAVRAFRDLGARAEGLEADPALCGAARERFGVDLRQGDVETIYRVTDVPLRAARALRRRLEGRTRWPDWQGSGS